ncbi:hypothetical protein [Saccharomonospora saliphila]|nr:hypothetical protein [Saccharomonospora saliphila]
MTDSDAGTEALRTALVAVRGSSTASEAGKGSCVAPDTAAVTTRRLA